MEKYIINNGDSGLVVREGINGNFSQIMDNDAEKGIPKIWEALAKLTSDLATTDANVAKNKEDIATNASAISALDVRLTAAEETIVSHTQRLESLESRMDSAESRLDSLELRMTEAEKTIVQHTQEIETNRQNIASNLEKINTNAENIQKNADAIAALDVRVTKNEGNIASLTTRMETAEAGIAENKTNIAGLTTRMVSAENTIAVHSADIFQMQDNIGYLYEVTGTSTGDISSIRANITELQNAVAALQGSVADLDALRALVNTKAPIDSPQFTGFVTVPTILEIEEDEQNSETAINKAWIYKQEYQKAKPDGTNPIIDSNSKFNTHYIPDFLLGALKFGGVFNAAGTITSDDSTLNGKAISTISTTTFKGYFFICQAPYTFGGWEYMTGDWAVANGSQNWAKIDNTDTVMGVKGDKETNYRIGLVNITPANIGAAAEVHTHTKSQITDFPTSLPANGGNADTVDGLHAAAVGTVVGGRLVSYDANGYINAAIFKSTFAQEGTVNVGSIMVKNGTDDYIRATSVANFRAKVMDGVYVPIAGGVTIAGAMTFSALSTFNNGIALNGKAIANCGEVQFTSDERLKSNISPLLGGDAFDLDKVRDISAFSFVLNASPDLPRVGYVAQRIREKMPYFVTEHEGGILNVDYLSIHTAKIAVLEKENIDLKNKLADLLRRVEDLEQAR